jgi:hypothetical protein
MVAQERLTRMLGLGDGSGATGWRRRRHHRGFRAGLLVGSCQPARARPLLGTAVLGKAIGVGACLAGVAVGRVQRGAIVVVLFNDAAWLPAFARLALVRSNRHAT